MAQRERDRNRQRDRQDTTTNVQGLHRGSISWQQSRQDVSYRSTGSQGHKTWGIEQVRQFGARHPIGTKARLALALLLYLGQRRGDTTKFGVQHVRNSDQVTEELRKLHGGRWIVFTQQKNRKRKPVTLWLPILPELEEIIAASPVGDLTFLVTAFGKGFTDAGFGNWFRDRCDEAGLQGYSAHGLRKAGATQAADRGASEFALMAIFGWRSGKQAVNYTRAAKQKLLAATWMHVLGQGRNRIAALSDTTPKGVAKTGTKSLKLRTPRKQMVPRGGV